MMVRDRIGLRLALIGVLAGALGLAACGRKGGLDLPPTSSNAVPAGGTAAAPGAPPDKRLPIDVLLN